MLEWIRAGAGWEFGRRNSGPIVLLTVLLRLWPLTLALLVMAGGWLAWTLRPATLQAEALIRPGLIGAGALVVLWLFIVSIRGRVWPLTVIVLALAAVGTMLLLRPEWLQPAGIALAVLTALALFVRFGLARR